MEGNTTAGTHGTIRARATDSHWRWLHRSNSTSMPPTSTEALPKTAAGKPEVEFAEKEHAEVAVLVRMPFHSSLRHSGYDAEDLGPLVMGVTRAPLGATVSSAEATNVHHSNCPSSHE